MREIRDKHKRGERGSTEDEVNSAKKPNMEAADCTNNSHSEVEDSEVNFYKIVSEHEPSLKNIKDMLSFVQATLKDIQHENRNMADELAEQKSSFGIRQGEKANNAMKLQLQALREKFNKRKSTTDELCESLDDLERYSRKNSLEIHGVPEDLYTSAEDVVIRLSELLDEPVRGEDIDITHKIYSSKNKGLNYLWHIDGYDKLKPFGFCVHGAIDRFSRRILWLEVASSNNDPRIVTQYYLDCLRKLGGTAHTVQGDRGMGA